MANDLVAFLRARLDERAAKAHDAHDLNCRAETDDPTGLVFDPALCDCGLPDLVLAEVQAKRRIIERHAPIDPCDAHDASLRSGACDTLRLLALPYAGHDDYRVEWEPDEKR